MPRDDRRRPLAYPTDHVLAVLDDPGRATEAADALRSAGFGPDEVAILADPEAGEAAGAAGGEAAGRLERRPGLRTRLLRLVRFATMDQLPDLLLYESAIAAGRVVVAVHVRDRATMHRARDALDGIGAHFINFYGRLYTEELRPWRGPELPMPDYLRR